MAEFGAAIMELGDKLANLRVAEAVQLKDYLKEKYSIEPAGGGVMMAPAAAAAAPVEKPAEVTDFQVVLEGLADPAKKIQVIKVVREITSLGLKEAKDMVEGAPKAVKETAPEGRGRGHQEEAGRRRRQGVAQTGGVKTPRRAAGLRAAPLAKFSSCILRAFVVQSIDCSPRFMEKGRGAELAGRTRTSPRIRNGGRFRCSHGGMQRATSQSSAPPATGHPPGSRPGFLRAPRRRGAAPHAA